MLPGQASSKCSANESKCLAEVHLESHLPDSLKFYKVSLSGQILTLRCSKEADWGQSEIVQDCDAMTGLYEIQGVFPYQRCLRLRLLYSLAKQAQINATTQPMKVHPRSKFTRNGPSAFLRLSKTIIVGRK